MCSARVCVVQHDFVLRHAAAGSRGRSSRERSGVGRPAAGLSGPQKACCDATSAAPVLAHAPAPATVRSMPACSDKEKAGHRRPDCCCPVQAFSSAALTSCSTMCSMPAARRRSRPPTACLRARTRASTLTPTRTSPWRCAPQSNWETYQLGNVLVEADCQLRNVLVEVGRWAV